MPPNAEDASGAQVALPPAPARIVSLVPSVTETLFALGLGDRLVGVTDWCIHPADAVARLARVRGTKNPDVDAIQALAPDLVLANLEENREVDVRRMRERGLCVWVDFPCTVAETIDHVSWLADLGPTSSGGAQLLTSLRSAATAANGATNPRRCFLAVWKDPWMSISEATYAHDLLRLLGLRNVFADRDERYPRVTLEEIRDAAPEVILLPDEPYAFTGDDARDLHGALATTPAAASGEIHVVDGTLAFWPGPRTTRALTEGLRPKTD